MLPLACAYAILHMDLPYDLVLSTYKGMQEVDSFDIYSHVVSTSHGTYLYLDKHITQCTHIRTLSHKLYFILNAYHTHYFVGAQSLCNIGQHDVLGDIIANTCTFIIYPAILYENTRHATEMNTKFPLPSKAMGYPPLLIIRYIGIVSERAKQICM